MKIMKYMTDVEFDYDGYDFNESIFDNPDLFPDQKEEDLRKQLEYCLAQNERMMEIGSKEGLE